MSIADENENASMRRKVRGSALAEIWSRHRFSVLLLMLVVNILIAPVIVTVGVRSYPHVGAAVMLLSFTWIIVVAVLAACDRGVTRLIAWIIGVPAIALAWLDLFIDYPALFAARQAFLAVFIAMAVVLLVRHVFRERRVTLNVLNATLCAYLFLGVGWATGYALIEFWQPGSFSAPEGSAAMFLGQSVDASVSRVYFSFVTLLTLGYGDVVPVSSMARLSTVIEAFTGQVFLVVLISRLVGIHVAQSIVGASRSELSED